MYALIWQSAIAAMQLPLAVSFPCAKKSRSTPERHPGNAPAYNCFIASSIAAKRFDMVASVSSPMFEMRKVVPLILP